ncbi:MAG TPA: trypsin-like peptidase domain-containing protein [Lacipirellulaceae bacterium]|nr:trypsin-like peptidase domain-containing protein [Lacipirellulaceae bacterium]
MVRSRLNRILFCASLVILAWPRAGQAETVLLDFTSPSCGPCAEMEPVLRQLEAEGHRIQRVDVSRDPRLVQQHRIDVTPTYLVVIDGVEWGRVSGKTALPTMREMLRHAAELAAASSPTQAVVSPVDFSVPQASDPAAAAGTSPMEGRVVPIGDPFAVRTASTSAPASASGASATSGAGAPMPANVAAARGPEADRFVAATVRLSIADPEGKSTGTGAIVDARNGMALVLTCGHLFRESKGQGAIELTLFNPGVHGAEVRGRVAGELIDYDLERDLALVRFRTESQVTVTPIAPLGTAMSPGGGATCVGCSHGENPTAWSTRLTTINRYQGHPNVQAVGAPVEGRSGGPLYNDRGQLIGVCFASDQAGNEGLYASLGSIHAKLDELQLASVYQSPSTNPIAQPSQLASALGPAGAVPVAAQGPDAIRGQSPVSGSTAPAEGWPTPAAPPASVAAATGAAELAAQLSAEERAVLDEIARRSAGGEVICIIRPQTPEGRSDVIKLSGVSPAFVRALAASAAKTVTAGSSPSPGAIAPAVTAAAPGGLIR